MSRTLWVLLIALGLSTASCTKDNPAFLGTESICGEGEFYVLQPFLLADASKVDILFVVDNGPNMLVNQQALGRAMPRFVEALNDVDGLDWRIAVTSTDAESDGGALLTGVAGQAGCPATRPPIVNRTTSEAGLAAGCNVVLGESSRSIPQGLGTARLAIEGDNNFSRDDARLVVVFFSNRDDCTPSAGFDRSDLDNCVRQRARLFPFEDLAGYFNTGARGRAGNPVSVMAITAPRDGRNVSTGPIQPACTGASPAFSADRYIALTEFGRLAHASMHSSICTTQFDDALDQLLDHSIFVTSDNVCPQLPMVRFPEAVVVRRSESDEGVSLSEYGDFLAIGPTRSCGNGAVAIRTDTHTDATGHRVEVWFCTDVSPDPR